MAYETNQANNPTDLKSKIETFLTTQGYSSAADINTPADTWFSKGNTHIKLKVPLDGGNPSLKQLDIYGATSSDGSSGVCPSRRCIYIDTASWPVTYYFMYFGTPDTFSCALLYDGTKMQYLFAGELVKVHSSAYTGGNFFQASKSVSVPTNSFNGGLSDTNLLYSPSLTHDPTLFHTPSVSYTLKDNTGFYTNIDASGWGGAAETSTAGKIGIPDYIVSAFFRSPNTWNQQTHLVPIHVVYVAPSSSYKMYLGYVEHIRYVRMDNFQLGDVKTLGNDQWKLFPMYQIDKTNRNGAAGSYGTMGYALKIAQ